MIATLALMDHQEEVDNFSFAIAKSRLETEEGIQRVGRDDKSEGTTYCLFGPTQATKDFKMDSSFWAGD